VGFQYVYRCELHRIVLLLLHQTSNLYFYIRSTYFRLQNVFSLQIPIVSTEPGFGSFLLFKQFCRFDFEGGEHCMFLEASDEPEPYCSPLF